MTHGTQITLRIAGRTIRLEEPQGHPCLAWPLAPFQLFLAHIGDPPDIHVEVVLTAELPDLSRGQVRYDTCHGYWTLCESAGGFLLECLDPRTRTPRSRSLISADFSHVQVWALPQRMEQESGWAPMQILNPIVEVCLLTRVAWLGGILLHAAGVRVDGKGLVFAGPSGSGKSTLADLFAASGASVLSDERVMIARSRHGFTMWGTPWVGSGRHARNESAPLSALLCLHRGLGRHHLDILSRRALFTCVLSQCVLPDWDHEAVETTLAVIAELIEQVDCARLAFLNDPSIVEWVTARIPSGVPVPS